MRRLVGKGKCGRLSRTVLPQLPLTPPFLDHWGITRSLEKIGVCDGRIMCAMGVECTVRF